MALQITINLSDLEEKCIRYFASSPEEWANNFIQARIYAAKQEIYQNEVRRMTNDPEVVSIPASVDAVVEAAQVEYANSNPEIPPMAPPEGV